MTRKEYLAKLRRYLKRLPQADYQEAMDYFEEYFDEAGPEQEAQVIAELGNPREAANDIIQNVLDKHLLDGAYPNRSGVKILWIALAALLVSPIMIPFIMVLCAFVVSLFLFGLAGIFGLLVGVVLSFAEAVIFAKGSMAAMMMALGLALLCLAGLLLALLVVWLLVKLVIWSLVALARWISKRGKKA